MIWFAVLAGSIGCYVEKLVGHLLPASVLEREGVRRIAGLLPVALLAALVAVQTFA
ncbi:MAG: AzlD domain-containing protein, partial [bacterium]|nr:AzlD domain-containing protein [bacterium]